eukprot:10718675-Heterocapsa_arctica.AAC.1
MMELQKENDDDKTNDADTGVLTNNQARKRAEEKHNEVNANKIRKHIEAHQKNNEFEIPSTEDNRNKESTDEQTNHILFN